MQTILTPHDITNDNTCSILVTDILKNNILTENNLDLCNDNHKFDEETNYDPNAINTSIIHNYETTHQNNYSTDTILTEQHIPTLSDQATNINNTMQYTIIDNTNHNQSEILEDKCRICYESSTQDNKLIHPCMCQGSVKHIHEKCLTKWMQNRDNKDNTTEHTCELCHFKYKINYNNKVKFSSKLFNGYAKKFIISLTVFVLLIISAFVTIYFVISGYIDYID